MDTVFKIKTKIWLSFNGISRINNYYGRPIKNLHIFGAHSFRNLSKWFRLPGQMPLL